eukprot:scaffold301_cov243-Pinguiococcus_pyrenoidosus.AAC.19
MKKHGKDYKSRSDGVKGGSGRPVSDLCSTKTACTVKEPGSPYHPERTEGVAGVKPRYPCTFVFRRVLGRRASTASRYLHREPFSAGDGTLIPSHSPL